MINYKKDFRKERAIKMNKAKKWIYLNNEIMVKENGEFQLNKDKEAVYSYFVDYVNKNTVFFHNLKEKMDYLIENDYYINFYDMYKFEEIKQVFELVYNKKFRFASFMSASKFYQSYALRDDSGEKFLERYEDRIAIVSLYLAQGDLSKAMEYAEMLINQEYQNHLLSLRNRGGFGTVADGYNSYEAVIGNYGFSCPRDNIRGILDTYYTCQCTSYAAYKAVEYWGPRVRVTGWGNAYSWASAARSLGYRVDRIPSANSIGQTASGAWGHVFWVESVNANGTINVSEYNNAYSSRSGQWGDFGYRVGVNPSEYYFIHFD